MHLEPVWKSDTSHCYGGSFSHPEPTSHFTHRIAANKQHLSMVFPEQYIPINSENATWLVLVFKKCKIMTKLEFLYSCI